MIEAVFISDLHLHPERDDINQLFFAFLQWAKDSKVQNIYILGDFFHVWAGDDSLDEWSIGIASRCREIVQSGIRVFYMHGNRDFLLGVRFAHLAQWSLLKEPTLISLGEQTVLLAHGDQYCTKDIAHQRFRRLTRNKFFIWFFLKLPLAIRLKLVSQIRKKSQATRNKPVEIMEVTPHAVLEDMLNYKASLLIHGHTHKPGMSSYEKDDLFLRRYVLSDWDVIPWILCYNETVGVYFERNWLGAS
ncbi:MAG: UDP-2,3-diacylglucosamine diphosphatase [Legionella sp.]|nr:MAG: UDP-2,3-diacylglucosamine diphosphatase [Legionella sp.]PJD98979.1 MAG: UDP-2,3-diacylglucosamine diphosphatase [Legionella sp.]